jgi:hypothetical protein
MSSSSRLTDVLPLPLLLLLLLLLLLPLLLLLLRSPLPATEACLEGSRAS